MKRLTPIPAFMRLRGFHKLTSIVAGPTAIRLDWKMFAAILAFGQATGSGVAGVACGVLHSLYGVVFNDP